MTFQRRDFIKLSATTGATAFLTGCATGSTAQNPVEDPFSDLKSMTGDVKPITIEERLGRIEKARELMGEHGMDAIYLEGGSSMFYYLGFRWGNSERMMAAVIPREGEVAYVCPHFEEERLRELIVIGDEVRVWEEHESPYKLVADIFKDRGISSGTIGIEERVRFFLYEGIRKEATAINYVLATPVTAGCRMIKSANEIALMQVANDITIEAYKKTLSLMYEGMSQGEFASNCSTAMRKLGASGGIFCQFGKYTALPHGSIEPQILKEGDIVLMDGGCKIEGYSSDITRTTVLGKPTARQTEVWDVEKEAQAMAFEAAKVGTPCEEVDKAARDYLTSKGFGPDYKFLLHRTGHGIGLDGHEWINFVKGNKTPLAPGMCFSNEPMIAIKDEMGIRLEDCLYMTEEGPKYFTKPSISIDQPFG